MSESSKIALLILIAIWSYLILDAAIAWLLRRVEQMLDKPDRNKPMSPTVNHVANRQ